MDLFEYQGKQYFARYGIPVSAGGVADTVDEAVAAAEQAGYPVVVKAQVHVGGRDREDVRVVGQGQVCLDQARAAGRVGVVDVHRHGHRAIGVHMQFARNAHAGVNVVGNRLKYDASRDGWAGQIVGRHGNAGLVDLERRVRRDEA